MSIEQIAYLKAQVRMYREKWETVQPLIDCRVCDHYHGGSMPCRLTAECVDGRGWTRTKVVKIYERPNAKVTGRPLDAACKSDELGEHDGR